MIRKLMKSKAVNSRLHFKNIRTRLKCKRSNSRANPLVNTKLFGGSSRSQESIGMSFNMIFSIILIIFFFVAAFVAIKYFLAIQKEMQFRTFFESFQNKIDEFYGSGGSVGNEYIFQKNAPPGVTALCYLDLNALDYSGSIYNAECTAIQRQFSSRTANFAFYSTNYDKTIIKVGYKMINHINAASLPPGVDTSCYCIPVINKKINITISTSTENPIVQIK